MRLIADIDLSEASIGIFEAYERTVLPRLSVYGGRLEMRVRSADQQREIHLLFFPDRESLVSYLDDPVRQSVMDQWDSCGATSSTVEVEAI
jgi:hypothetical protein